VEAQERFSAHELNYALLGLDDGKMQVSFKYRLHAGVPFYLAYSNTVVWDVFEQSGPYRDVNFLPELFYRFGEPGGAVSSVDLGYLHYSNGRGGSESRSWDRLYARARLERSAWSRPLTLEPTAYIPIAYGSNNPDIADYLGYWKVESRLGRLLDPTEENLALRVGLVSGEDGVPFDRGALTLGLSYDLRAGGFHPLLFAEYFVGYGNSILEYDQRSEVLRVGLILE
jgi:phospholipase A1